MAPPRAVSHRKAVALDIPAAWLLGLMAGWLVLDHALLYLFLGRTGLAALALVALLIVPRFVAGARALGTIPLARVAACIGVAAVILVLGGEGGWLYANTDWQVRDAVLRDMALNPWPFTYLEHGNQFLLRAPLGMYLLPAAVWKASGAGAGALALLAQNSILTGMLLALGSQLYYGARQRAIALVVVVGFSGLDWLGSLILRGGLLDHLDAWAPGLQYSSSVTLAFWVPHHAMAGWITGLAFLLYRAGKIGLAPFLAIVPLTALWSPLALMGTIPWAALAGWRAWRSGALTWRDCVLPAATTVLVLPCLSYLSAAGDTVGMRIAPASATTFLLFELLEVLPWMLPLLVLNSRSRYGSDVALLTAALLVVLPQIQVGWSNDLMMRGSIPTLLIVTLGAADILARATAWRKPGWHWWLAAVAVLGWPTGWHEADRAFSHPPVTYGTCNLLELWRSYGENLPNGTYFAPLARSPHWLAEIRGTPLPTIRHTQCWDQPWYQP